MEMSKPKLGIRPIIDARCGGVREKFEEKTMDMARKAKKLIEENVFYSDGSPFECIISPCTIGGSKEASICEDCFSEHNVCATLSVAACWSYGTETIDMNPLTLKAVWGFNGTNQPGAAYLSAIIAAHAQKGLPVFAIYSQHVQDDDDTEIPNDTKEELLRFARCACAIGQIRGKSYVSIGGASMGIAGSHIDANLMQEYLGVRSESIDMVEILRRMENGIYDKEEYEKALKWVQKNCPEGVDSNPEEIRHTDEQKKKEWEFSIKMTLICRDILLGNEKLRDVKPQGDELKYSGPKDGWNEEALGKNAIFAGFQSERNWNDFLPKADFTESILNSSFDWNGIKEPFILATQNDSLNACAMLFGKLLTGRATLFADVRTYWSPETVERLTGKRPMGLTENGFIHMINSGSAALDATGMCRDNMGRAVLKKWWTVTQEDIENMLAATDWCPADLKYSRGGGFSSHFKTQAVMPVTMIRINNVKGLGPVLMLAEGYTAALSDELHAKLDDKQDPTWPTTWFVPRLTGEGAFKSVYTVLSNWGANHAALAYGHIGKDLITLSSMLRIPVAMHNIEESDIFRPQVWSLFGTRDLENADYRACSTYGALYK